MRLFAGEAQQLTLRMRVSVDCMILPPEQKPGTRVKAHNESVDAISPTPDIVSRFAWIGEDSLAEVGFCKLDRVARPPRPSYHRPIGRFAFTSPRTTLLRRRHVLSRIAPAAGRD
jgi:hypothetical protein